MKNKRCIAEQVFKGRLKRIDEEKKDQFNESRKNRGRQEYFEIKIRKVAVQKMLKQNGRNGADIKLREQLEQNSLDRFFDALKREIDFVESITKKQICWNKSFGSNWLSQKLWIHRTKDKTKMQDFWRHWDRFLFGH